MRRQDSNLRPPGYEAVSSTNRSHFGSDLCFLPPFVRRIFHCFRPSLPAFFGFWVKSGSEKILKLQNKSCQAFVQYNFYHVDTRNLECWCRLSILRFRAPYMKAVGRSPTKMISSYRDYVPENSKHSPSSGINTRPSLPCFLRKSRSPARLIVA